MQSALTFDIARFAGPTVNDVTFVAFATVTSTSVLANNVFLVVTVSGSVPEVD